MHLQSFEESHAAMANHSSSQSAAMLHHTYRWASTLFLTRRLREAYSTIEPVVSPKLSPGSTTSTFSPGCSRIAEAPRSLRIKVWCLYITLLDAIIRLGPDEGKKVFGRQLWRDLAAKVRNSEIWEDVIRTGYHGAQGNVDVEVVVNL